MLLLIYKQNNRI